jgi:hypothetical protein
MAADPASPQAPTGHAALALDDDDDEEGEGGHQAVVRLSNLHAADEGVIKRAVDVAHAFVRGTLGESAVSQRDLHRVFKLWRFLMWHAGTRARRSMGRARGRGDALKRQLLMRSALVALGVVYYLRLSPAHREALAEALGRVGMPSIKAAVEEEAELYMRAIPEAATPGVTRNAALKENVFAITVCIQVGLIGWID